MDDGGRGFELSDVDPLDGGGILAPVERRPALTRIDVVGVITGIGFLLALYLALLWAPTEATMGDIQRLFYFHMPSAWIALGPAFTVMFVCSILYLAKKDLRFDRMAVASTEIGVMFTTAALVTGAIWAKRAWGAYWIWEPRLTATLVLWFIYAGYLLLRSGLPPGHKRARLAAIFGIAGWIDVPLVFVSVRWSAFHPVVVSGQGMNMDSSMASVLIYCLGVFTLAYVHFLVLRTGQESLKARLEYLRRRRSTRKE